jgi:hypothetical protein
MANATIVITEIPDDVWNPIKAVRLHPGTRKAAVHLRPERVVTRMIPRGVKHARIRLGRAPTVTFQASPSVMGMKEG